MHSKAMRMIEDDGEAAAAEEVAEDEEGNVIRQGKEGDILVKLTKEESLLLLQIMVLMVPLLV